jgi:quercetin dioxygenase-like cupin family protein
MESKSNEATPLRPQGDRILNAAMVDMDLNQFIAQIRSESTWKEGCHNSITVFKSDKLRLVLIGLHARAELKEHQAAALIIVHVLQGKIAFTANEQTLLLEKGQMVALHEKILHKVHAEEESFFLLSLVK